MGERVVVALGGNAILQPGQRGTSSEQMENVHKTVSQIVKMIEAGYEVALTHGNGPQVGALLIQNELGSSHVPAMPMDYCGAESQGFIGYMFSQCLTNAMAEHGVTGRNPVCVVTRVEVDPEDNAFKHPTKPVGPFYSEEVAKSKMQEKDETWIEDAGRGWRRVVPSPDPKCIVESEVIRHLVRDGFIVVASGGGGIPVIKDEHGRYVGVEAVIDKDLAGERLAQELGADTFVILTDVPNVAINYNTPEQRWLETVSIQELEDLKTQGHFKAGSMGPKVEAALRFVKNGGQRSIISSLDHALEALKGNAGTQITR